MNLASRLQGFAEPMSIVAHDEMKEALVEMFSLTDLGRREVRGIGEMRLIGISTTIERERMPGFS